MQTFSIGESLRFGWSVTKEHSGLLFKVMLSFFALQIAEQIVARTIGNTLEGGLATAALWGLSVIMGAGMTLISLKLARAEAATYLELFPWNQMAWRFFLMSIMVGLAAAGCVVVGVVGALLAFLLGSLGGKVLGFALAGVVALVAALLFVHVAVRLSLARYAVVDGARAFESLTRSAALARGEVWHLLGFLVVTLLVNILGAILLLIGLLVSVPVTTLAWAHVYLKLKQRA